MPATAIAEVPYADSYAVAQQVLRGLEPLAEAVLSQGDQGSLVDQFQRSRLGELEGGGAFQDAVALFSEMPRDHLKGIEKQAVEEANSEALDDPRMPRESILGRQLNQVVLLSLLLEEERQQVLGA